MNKSIDDIEPDVHKESVAKACPATTIETVFEDKHPERKTASMFNKR